LISLTPHPDHRDEFVTRACVGFGTKSRQTAMSLDFDQGFYCSFQSDTQVERNAKSRFSDEEYAN
jgi:hypothetical protein